MNMRHALLCLRAVFVREMLRFVQQRERFLAALVRPLLWLLVFAAGLRMALGIAITPPYQTYITYEVYIVPGLIGMIQLFNGMQSSLSMVYDREMGSMRVLLTTPLPRWFLLVCKLLAGVAVSIVQVYAFLAIALAFGIELPWAGLLTVLPALVVSGLMLGAIGLLLSTMIRQLENFAGVMNFVIFPMFFLSSALYPLWKMQEAGMLLWRLCSINPFTWAVELIRFALYGELEPGGARLDAADARGRAGPGDPWLQPGEGDDAAPRGCGPAAETRLTVRHRQSSLAGEASSQLTALCFVPQQVIGENQRHHRFRHRHAADGDAGIVAALGDDLGVLALGGDGGLRYQDGARRLDGDAGDDVLAGGNPAENAAGVVREKGHGAVAHAQAVVVLRS